MEYLKEVQAFAGRFSAAAEEKLASVDGGTYNRFIRFYSKSRSEKAKNDDEQRQMDILLDELQLATEAPALLSAPPGTVLHMGAVENGVGLALANLCVAVEKCLFFGAAGVAPDFWQVLKQAGSEELPSAGAGAGACVLDEEGNIAQGASSRKDGDSDVVAQGDGRIDRPLGTRTSTSAYTTDARLSNIVSGLTRIHTGHGRCRAWARGLLGLDNESSAGMELRKAAAAAVATREKDRVAASTTGSVGVGSHIDDGVVVMTGASCGSVEKEACEPTRNGHLNGDAHHDASRGGESSDSNRAMAQFHTANSADNNSIFESTPGPAADPSPRPLSPHLLPLWLRPGFYATSVLENICICLLEFRGRLDERALSVRLSLDHAWFDQENVTAITIFTWPRFPRDHLRCYVRGAGLTSADGEYAAAADHAGEIGNENGVGTTSLVLIGPNGCQIYQVCCTDDGDESGVAGVSAAAAAVDANATAVGGSDTVGDADGNHDLVAIETMGTPSETSADVGVAIPMAAVPVAAPCVVCWCIVVTGEQPMANKRIAYYCQGDGVLPPSHGWRATDPAEMPAPVLMFGTYNEGGAQGVDHEGRPKTSGASNMSGASFKPALAAVEQDSAAAGAVAWTRRSDDVSSVDKSGDSTSQGMAGYSAYVAVGTDTMSVRSRDKTSIAPASVRRIPGKRRKRRRPPEADGATSFCSNSTFFRKSRIIQDGDADHVDSRRDGESPSVWSGAVGGGTSTGNDRVGQGSCAACIPVVSEVGKSNEGEADVAAFMAERWRLPKPDGELLLRAERTRRQLLLLAEKQALSIATRRNELLERRAGADDGYREVLQESMAVTVDRILARSTLRERAEAEASARDAQLASECRKGTGGPSERLVPSLEELVAEKAEELRIRSLDRSARMNDDDGSSAGGGLDRDSGEGVGGFGKADGDQDSTLGSHLVDKSVLGWPWPITWLLAPRAPTVTTELPIESMLSPEMLEFARLDCGNVEDSGKRADDEEGIETPPFSMEMAAVEIADAEDLDAAHIEYVLRVTYREVRPSTTINYKTPSTELGRVGGAGSSAGSVPSAVVPRHDPGANGLMEIAATARGLVQRTRVLSKRLSSLCALHPRLMWELEEERRAARAPRESEAGVEHGRKEEEARAPEECSMEGTTTNPPVFPDPFELGTLEESVLRVHRDKLTPRFKANSSIRKLSARIGSYLSSLLYYLGVLEVTGHASLRARLSRALNEALSTCDRVGRKRRRADLILCMRTWDDPGGKLESWVDEEARLRIQHRRCMGCGRAIAAEFLGMKKDYTPCRFANGLFCRRHCHDESRRVIPHRAVHHWDFTLHRVSKAAAAFLDATRFLPVIHLAEVAPHLFLDYQVLCLVRWRRTQLHLLRRVIIFPPERVCAAGARLLEKTLHGRIHLAVDPGLYSVEDLIGVKKGTLIDFLEEAVEALLVHVMDECEACETEGCRSCSICHAGDRIYPFQTSTVARCDNCENLFHARCVVGKSALAASGSSKWWVDVGIATKTFLCPECKLPTLICP